MIQTSTDELLSTIFPFGSLGHYGLEIIQKILTRTVNTINIFVSNMKYLENDSLSQKTLNKS